MESVNKVYCVHLINKNELKITGNGNSQVWKKAVPLTDFISPWDLNYVSKTEFRALWDGDYFFFCFAVFDSSIHINRIDDSVEGIANSDRVELFFKPDATLNPYYCLEIDSDARILDFIAYPKRRFDYNWKWPKDCIQVKSSVNENGFIVEGAITIASLNQLNLIQENCIQTGVYRAKYNSVDRINFEPTWLSWVDPKTEMPDFHIASSFGMFQLVDLD